MLMMLSVFGIVTASAAAANGWAAVADNFSLTVTNRGARNVEVSWLAFTAGTGQNFWDMQSANAITATWLVRWRPDAATAWADVTTANGITVLPERSANRLTVILTPGTNNRYGEFEVTLTLTAGSGESAVVKAGRTTVYLINDAVYREVLAKAQAAARDTRRYTQAYIDSLNAAIAQARLLVDVSNPTPERFAQAISVLNAALANPQLQLTGIGFIDALIPNFIISGIWWMVDVYEEITSFWDNWFGPNTVIGGFFGRFDILSVFRGMFGLIPALIALILF
jgi:hypothetical protein